MEELHTAMKKVLANTFAMYMKAHGYHWNVIGPDFPQLHDLFGNIYGELWAAIDVIAEEIRAADSFAPGTLARMIELCTINEDEKIPTAANMIKNLLAANEEVISCLTDAYKVAEEKEQIGLSNFLQDRIDIHKKHSWMLKAVSGRKD